MNDRPIQATPSLPATSAPAPRVGAGAPTATAPAVAGDRVAIGRRPPAIEADLRLSMVGGPNLAADGTVKVQRAFLERFIRKVLADKRTFPSMALAFDPATKRYTSEGTVRWHGVPVPVEIAARPVVVGDKIGVKFEDPYLVLGSMRVKAGWLARFAAGAVLKEMQKTQLYATKGQEPGLVLLSPSSLMHELGIVPPYVALDGKRTKLDAALGQAGDFTLTLKADGVPAAPAATPRSDVALAADEAALEAIMRHAMGGDYEVGGIALREGGAAVRGKADYKPVSDTLNLAKSIMLLAALSGGRPAQGLDDRAVSVKGDLDLDVKVEGRTMTIKPSISMAAGEMLKVFERAGVPAEKVPGGVRVDMDAAAAKFGATLNQLRIDEHGVTLQANLDVDRLLRDQRLVDEERPG